MNDGLHNEDAAGFRADYCDTYCRQGGRWPELHLALITITIFTTTIDMMIHSIVISLIFVIVNNIAGSSGIWPPAPRPPRPQGHNNSNDINNDDNEY